MTSSQRAGVARRLGDAGETGTQAAGGILLRQPRLKGLDGRPRDFYVRQLHDWKGGVNAENERDYEAFVKVVKAGRLRAETGL